MLQDHEARSRFDEAHVRFQLDDSFDMQTSTRHTLARVARCATCALIGTTTAIANHGPGTSGGGSSTVSGETLKAGAFELSLRTDWTKFESFTREEAEAHAAESGEFDAIDSSWLETFALTYGVTDDLQLGAQLGYYRGNDFIDAESDGGPAESSTADPAGLSDLWLQAKWRVMHGQHGHLALLGGVKLPTGKDDERLDNGELLEPSSQPGTGSVDWQAGVGYSRFLTSRVTLDASAVYTLRTEHDDFTVGDRLDLGVAFAYRITESVQQYPNYSVSAELLGVSLAKDDEDGEKNDNSGGDTLYLAPGARVRFNEHIALSLAPAFPIHQDLNGDQVETRTKATLDLSVSF